MLEPNYRSPHLSFLGAGAGVNTTAIGRAKLFLLWMETWVSNREFVIAPGHQLFRIRRRGAPTANAWGVFTLQELFIFIWWYKLGGEGIRCSAKVCDWFLGFLFVLNCWWAGRHQYSTSTMFAFFYCSFQSKLYFTLAFFFLSRASRTNYVLFIEKCTNVYNITS